jgi:hypothetical protein
MSMATIASLFWSSILAAVTYWLPGPRILCTCAHARGAARKRTFKPFDLAMTYATAQHHLHAAGLSASKASR